MVRVVRVLKGVGRKFVIVTGAYVLGIMLVLGGYAGVAISHGLEYSLTFVYGFCPVLQIRDSGNVLLPLPYNGRDFDVPAGNYGPVVVVDEACWDNKQFLNHELEHVRQRYKYLFLGFHLLYAYSEPHRIVFEYEAFRAENAGVSKEEIALQLSMEIYGNVMSRDQILAIIDRYTKAQLQG